MSIKISLTTKHYFWRGRDYDLHNHLPLDSRFPTACVRLTANQPAAPSDLRHETGRPQSSRPVARLKDTVNRNYCTGENRMQKDPRSYSVCGTDGANIPGSRRARSWPGFLNGKGFLEKSGKTRWTTTGLCVSMPGNTGAPVTCTRQRTSFERPRRLLDNSAKRAVVQATIASGPKYLTNENALYPVGVGQSRPKVY